VKMVVPFPHCSDLLYRFALKSSQIRAPGTNQSLGHSEMVISEQKGLDIGQLEPSEPMAHLAGVLPERAARWRPRSEGSAATLADRDETIPLRRAVQVPWSSSITQLTENV